jgi:hypothetical protein
MALWGISTTTETQDNNYGLPKHLDSADRNNTPWNCYADQRGWVYRRYGSTEQSGLSTSYYDEILVNVYNLNSGGASGGPGSPNGANETGLGVATPVAVFFEDPNQNSPISLGAGSTDKIRNNNQTAYVHVVWNEAVFCSAGATVLLNRSSGASIVATAGSVAAGAPVVGYAQSEGLVEYTNFNGQITNRVAFAFTSGNSGIGTVISIDLQRGVVGTITDFSGGGAAIKVLAGDTLKQVGGAGSEGQTTIGIGVTQLTVAA